MTAINEITGQRMSSRQGTAQERSLYEQNYDLIFGSKNKKENYPTDVPSGTDNNIVTNPQLFAQAEEEYLQKLEEEAGS